MKTTNCHDCGYIRPIDQWNVGKAEKYKDRKEYAIG